MRPELNSQYNASWPKFSHYGYGPSEVVLIIKLHVVCDFGKAYYDFRSF